MARRFLVAGALALMIGQPAAAQTAARPATASPQPTLAPLQQQPAMQVSVVRSDAPGCEPACPEWIAAQGRIDASSVIAFKKVLARLGTRKLPVLIDSPGGTVAAGFEIGRMIRQRGLEVAVTKTVLTTCAPTDAACKTAKAKGVQTGKPTAYLAICASSCAFVLAGGTRRHVAPWTLVGVHQLMSHRRQVKVLQTFRIETQRQFGVPVSVKRTLVSEKPISERSFKTEAPDSEYVKAAKYFAEMGIGDGIMEPLKSTPAQRMHWLNRRELTATGIATQLSDGEQLVLGRSTGAAMLATGSLPKTVAPAAPSSLTKPAGLPEGCTTMGSMILTCPGAAASPAAPASAPAAAATPAAGTTVAPTAPAAAKPKAKVAKAKPPRPPRTEAPSWPF